MANSPSTNGSNRERAKGGKFQQGNAGGPGNPHAKRVAQLRSILLSAVSEDDLREVVTMLVKKAKEGDMVAVRELLDRLVGRAPSAPDPSTFLLEKKRLRLQEKQLAIAKDRAWFGK